VKRHIKHANNY